jgi:type IV secretion system T-DNA border endonuclease VirD1
MQKATSAMLANNQNDDGRSASQRLLSNASAQNEVRRNAIEKDGLSGYTILSVRMRNAEFLDFSDQVEKQGLNNNRALRIAARRIAGFLEIDQDTRDILHDITLKIGGIAGDINEIAKIAKKRQTADAKDFLLHRQSLGAEFARLETQLQYLMNVSKRRQDGIKRLEEAAAG